MTARLRSWLIGVAVVVMLAVSNIGHDMHHLDHLAGKAFKGD